MCVPVHGSIAVKTRPPRLATQRSCFVSRLQLDPSSHSSHHGTIAATTVPCPLSAPCLLLAHCWLTAICRVSLLLLCSVCSGQHSDRLPQGHSRDAGGCSQHPQLRIAGRRETQQAGGRGEVRAASSTQQQQQQTRQHRKHNAGRSMDHSCPLILCAPLLCTAVPSRVLACRLSKELLLAPVVIARNEQEKCLIEGSVNSVRISILIKQSDELEKVLVDRSDNEHSNNSSGSRVEWARARPQHLLMILRRSPCCLAISRCVCAAACSFSRFLCQRAEDFIILRRAPTPVSAHTSTRQAERRFDHRAMHNGSTHAHKRKYEERAVNRSTNRFVRRESRCGFRLRAHSPHAAVAVLCVFRATLCLSSSPTSTRRT